MKLNNSEIDKLFFLLENTPIEMGDRIEYLKKNHPQIFKDTTISLIGTIDTIQYSKNNKILNEYLSNLFNENVDNLYAIHTITYNTGAECKEHIDSKSYKSVVILISDEFTGGNMIINGKLIDMKKIGDYIIFNGMEDLHGVETVTSGIRKVLVVWFSDYIEKDKKTVI